MLFHAVTMKDWVMDGQAHWHGQASCVWASIHIYKHLHSSVFMCFINYGVAKMRLHIPPS